VADEHLTMHQVAERTLAAANSARPALRVGPLWLLELLAHGSAPLARLFGFKPLIAPGELTFLQWNVRVDSSKAQRELAFRPTSANDGIRATVTDLL